MMSGLRSLAGSVLQTIDRYACDIAEWFSGLLCRNNVHSWDYGPGECCSRCGVADKFLPDAAPGRAVEELKTGCIRYLPSSYSLPDGWRYLDNQ